MERNKLFWLTDDSFSRPASEVHRHLEGIDVTTLCDIDELLARIGDADCILVSASLSPIDVEALSAAPVIVWRDQLTASQAVSMIRAGAFHCFDADAAMEDVREVIEAAISGMKSRALCRQREFGEKWRASLVGESVAMQIVAETIRLIAARKCTVLISGETGTGKEMVARAIHMASPRAHLPMVSVNCAALPENLLEAELFGHTKGAFTGAINHRVGRFEQAHKSTLFLDEVGDMPLDLQAKLLRILQDKEFQRLGCSETIKVDVRIIAASNVDLPTRVRDGKFREDLYYRLNVVPLTTPPLRLRGDDIPALVAHFLTKICRAEDIKEKRVAAGALISLRTQPWPGNIRQLENTIEMAIALSGDREVLTSRDFGLQSVSARVPAAEIRSLRIVPSPGARDFDSAISEFGFALLSSALQECAGNKTIAAEMLGIKRTTLIMKLKNLEKMQAAGAYAGTPTSRIPADSAMTYELKIPAAVA